MEYVHGATMHALQLQQYVHTCMRSSSTALSRLLIYVSPVYLTLCVSGGCERCL
jgi:hypothetical protein